MSRRSQRQRIMSPDRYISLFLSYLSSLQMCISDVDDLDMLYALFYVIFVSLNFFLLYRTPSDVKIPFGPKSVQSAARAQASVSTPEKSNTSDRKRLITSPSPAVYVYKNSFKLLKLFSNSSKSTVPRGRKQCQLTSSILAILNVFYCRQKEPIKESDVFSSDTSAKNMSEDDDVEIVESVLFCQFSLSSLIRRVQY
jgi:hypothetical protein